MAMEVTIPDHAIPMENLNLDFNDLKANVLAYVYM